MRNRLPKYKPNDVMIDLIRRYNKDSSDEEAYIEIEKECMFIINSLAKQIFGSGFDKDDLKQILKISLFEEIIPSYDENKGKFVKFASVTMRNVAINYLKLNTQRQYNLVLNKASSINTISDEDTPESNIFFRKIIVTDKHEFMNTTEDIRKILNRIDEYLTPLERKIWAYMKKGFSMGDITKKLCTKKNRAKPKVVDNAFFRIRDKLKDMKHMFPEEYKYLFKKKEGKSKTFK